MNSQINDILSKYQNEEITREEANAELAKLGAGFHLEPGRGPGWTDEEMKQGFFEIPEEQRKKTYPRTLDSSRRADLAGWTVRQKTASGEFDVTYDELGYAVKAIRVKED